MSIVVRPPVRRDAYASKPLNCAVFKSEDVRTNYQNTVEAQMNALTDENNNVYLDAK